MHKQAEPSLVLLIVLSAVLSGLLYVVPDALITNVVGIIWVIVGIVYCVLAFNEPDYMVYNIHGVIYCGPAGDIPEEATDAKYFNTFGEATIYCNQLSEVLSHQIDYQLE